MRLFAHCSLALAVSTALAAPVCAQTIEGQVTDSLSSVPVGRGFIVLLDDSGRERIRTLTTAEGRYSVNAPGTGTYRLRSERIGYRVWESADLELRAYRSYSLDPRINALPRQLASIIVTGETECRERKGPDTALLWEEARKALTAASWSAEQELYVHRVHMFERDFNRSRESILRERISVQTVPSALPFISEDPAQLAARGYVVPRDSGGWTWWGPDANVLLDPNFHQTHCFWAVRDEDELAGMIGLAFEPIPDRELPEVEGTLWLDEAAGELRTLEFHFVNNPMGVSADHLGGWATFLPMPSGAWILDGWELVIPNVGPAGRRVSSRRRRIEGYRYSGGRVLEVFSLEGRQIYEVPHLVTLKGTAYDSIQGGPLAGAMVSVVNTDYVAETDSAGMFQMRALLDGRYRITSSRHDWLGYRPGMLTVDFNPGDTVDVRLVVPSLETAHRNLCRRADPGRNMVLHGDVRTPDGYPLKDAEVVAMWEPGVERKDKTDETGQYVLCDLPNDVAMVVTVRHDAFAHDPVGVRFVEPDVVIETVLGQTSYYVPDRIVRMGLELVRGRR